MDGCNTPDSMVKGRQLKVFIQQNEINKVNALDINQPTFYINVFLL